MSAETVAVAYVQVVPSAEGIQGRLTKVMSGEADSAGEKTGKSFTQKFRGAVVKAVGALGLGKIVSQAFSEGAALEQSIGGVETLFGESAEIIKSYAKDAYMTAGVSANTYMEQSTSMAAALINSLGGDTAKAAEMANLAITSMADNSAKMGTDLESLQNAYAGFSRGNFTMLDNLKLGFSGSKEGMQELLAEAEKLSGMKFDISSYSDIVQAIDIVQQSMHIAGVAADEAKETFSGSLQAMKAAAQNFLGYLATGEGDLQKAIGDLISTAGTFLLDNAIPMLYRIVSALPPAVYDAIRIYGPDLMANGVEIVKNLVNGFLDGLPQFVESGAEIVSSVVNGLLANLPALMTGGEKAVNSLLNKIVEILPSVIATGGKLLMSIVTGIINNLPAILQTGITVVGRLAAGILNSLPKIASAALSLARQAVSSLLSFDWGTAGGNIVSGIARGITSGAINVINAIKNVCSSALGAVKRFFGIASPSKVMKQQGAFLMEGWEIGIEDNGGKVEDAVRAVSKNAYDASGTTLQSNVVPGRDEDVIELLETWLPKLAQMNVYLNGSLVGEVDRGLGKRYQRVERGVVV